MPSASSSSSSSSLFPYDSWSSFRIFSRLCFFLVSVSVSLSMFSCPSSVRIFSAIASTLSSNDSFFFSSVLIIVLLVYRISAEVFCCVYSTMLSIIVLRSDSMFGV